MGMAAGPFRPIFFAGHIGKSVDNRSGEYGVIEEEEQEEEDEEEEEDDEEEGGDNEADGDDDDEPKPEKEKKKKAKKEVAYDLYFNKKVYFLEGVHIVPKGINPPGLEIPFEGATAPALDSFNLEILARNVDTEELVPVLKLTVMGGVQWAPIENPLNTIAVDYLVFRGNFSTISVIIHGGEIEQQVLPSKSRDLVNRGIPVPAGWKDPEEDDTGFEYSSDEDNREESDKKKRRQGDRMVKIADPSAKIAQTMDMPVNSLHDSLSAYVPVSNDDLLTMFSTRSASPFPETCMIDVESAAIMVGKVFSLEEASLASSHAKLAETLDDLSMCLDECLMSVISTTTLASMESEEDKAKFAAFKDVFDEEAVHTLVSYVVKAQDLLRVGAEAIAFDGLKSLAEKAAAVEQVADTVIRMCESLLRNELTANSFASAGGLTKLATIAAQKPRLPSKLMTHLLETLCMGVKFAKGMASFIEVPLFDLSGYQSLASCMKEVRASDGGAATAGVEAMNWCQLFEASQRAGSYAEEMADSVSEIAKTITWHLSAVSMSSNEEELAVAAEKLPDAAPLLADSVSKLQEVHAQVKRLAVTVDAALVSITATRSCVVGQEEVQMAVVKILLETKIADFLTILGGLVGVSTDLVAIHEWGVPVDGQHSARLVLSCRSMLVGLVSRILAVGSTEVFFALSHQQVQELWTFLAPEAHLLSTQSIDEIDQAGTLKMRLASLGWSLKLMACAGNSVLKQGPYDLYDFFSFPAGAAVASRLGAVLVAPSLLVKMEVLSKLQDPSPSDFRTAEKGFRVLAHFLHSDHPGTVSSMAAHIPKLHALTKHYLALDDSSDHKKVKTAALRISRATSSICARTGKFDVDIASAAIDELLQASSVEREALPSLDVCFSVASVSADKLRDMALRAGPSGALTKLFVLSISAINKTCSWLRADAGLALDASVAVSGYEEDLFHGKYNPLPLAADSKGKAERLDADVAIHRAKLLFRCLLASVSLLDSLMEVLASTTARVSLQSPELIAAVEAANATVRQLYGVHKSGFLGLFSRRIAAACVSVFDRYCLSAQAASSSEESLLIPFLLSRAMEMPALFQANMDLVSELLLSSREAVQRSPVTEYMDVEGHASAKAQLSFAASFQNEVLESEEEAASFLDASASSAKAGFVKFWEKQLYSPTILSDGKRPVPFSLRYEGAKQLTGAHVLLEPSVTASEKRPALPWRDFGTGDLLGDSCDPSLPFVSSFIGRSFGVTDVLTAATISASPEVNEAASTLCVQVMTVSTSSAKRLSTTLLDRLQRLTFLNASLSAPLIAAGLKEKDRKKGTSEEPDEASEKLQENSDELCRVLILVDSLCSQASLSPCMALVNGGLVQSLLLCLRSCRQEVVALALQVLGTTYRQLAYCSSQLSSQALESGHSVAAECAKEVLGALADSLVELLPEILKRFQESEQTLVLAQTAILAQVFRLKHQKLFLDAVSKGLTIEFFVIKLWLSLEDSFQALVEITETFKGVGSEGIEDGEERLQAAFCAVAISAMALRCAAELALQAYNRGWVSLMILTRCMRVSLTDPRKVSMQFQRAYTMWWTNDRLQVEKARLAAHYRDSSKEKSRKSKDSAAAGHDAESGSSFVHPPVLQPQGLVFTEDSFLGGHTAARNAMINTSLRRVVETAAKVMEYNKSGDRVERMPCNDVFSATRGASVDFTAPFVTASVEQILAGASMVQQTVSLLDDIGGDNAFHLALRRVIVAGWEGRSSIFDCPQRYIRLRAAPRSVDPSAADRRRDRRKKRKLEEIADRKRRLEAAALEKQEIDNRRRALEEDREIMKMGEQLDGRPVVELSGVPMANMGGNISVRPIMDYGNQNR